ncbi:hypothetical protein JOB18_026436 [Solea senegalensis]|uniref:Uncharacterized protein n=1 Tax=Solea senegalensis TaxID=28829 RepID=A0AAV6QX02_SOLSE|nr:hypothetical protein JOB18_026436 [Solea senegalensis]
MNQQKDDGKTCGLVKAGAEWRPAKRVKTLEKYKSPSGYTGQFDPEKLTLLIFWKSFRLHSQAPLSSTPSGAV